MTETARLDDYLALIERERESRPAEAMLADEIVRLRDARKVCDDCGGSGLAHNTGAAMSTDGEGGKS